MFETCFGHVCLFSRCHSNWVEVVPEVPGVPVAEVADVPLQAEVADVPGVPKAEVPSSPKAEVEVHVNI